LNTLGYFFYIKHLGVVMSQVCKRLKDKPTLNASKMKFFEKKFFWAKN